MAAPLAELPGNPLERFVPRSRHEHSVLADQRRRQALGVPSHGVGVAPLDAQMAVIDGRVGAVDARDVVALHAHVELASHPTVSAGGAHLALEPRLAGVAIDVAERTGWA